MLKMKPNASGMLSPAKRSTWEIRPGGMLVQKRNSDPNQGELKEMLAGPTSLDPLDQKLIYKEKERDSKSNYGCRIVLYEDLESPKNANMDKALKKIAEISLEVDNVDKQVATLESEIRGGKKVMESVLSNLIELLMTQLINLDGIVAEGDVKLRRRMQVKRVQKYIETLDMLKTRNSMLGSIGARAKIPLQPQHKPITMQKQQEHRKQRNLAGPFTSASTTKHNTTNARAKLSWEFFE